MVVSTAVTADNRWGVSPTKKPAARAPKPANLPSQRGIATWSDKQRLLASNAWGSPSPLHPKNDGGSGLSSQINDRPSSRGSSTSSSTIGSDFLDLPSAWDPNSRPLPASGVLLSHSHHLPTTTNQTQSTETRSGSLQFSRFPDSFTNVVKTQLRTIGKQGATSHGKGFSLSMDDFPILSSKNPKSNSKQGHSSQGRPTFGSGSVAAQDEQRKSPITGVGEVILFPSYDHENIFTMDCVYEGGDPVPAAKLSREAKQAQLHSTQVPNICMPPPWYDYWHPPPDHPPDRNGILHREAAPYGPYKHADPPGSFPVESFAQYGQFLLNQEVAARQSPGHGGYHPDSEDPYPHIPADPFVTNKPHILVKVKDDHLDVLQKQPIIKKDLVLLQKIKCLNIKARNLRASNLPELSSSKEKVKHPNCIDAEADHVTEDVSFSVVTSETAPAFDRLNSVSETSKFVPNNPPNMPANGGTVVGPSEQITEFSKAVKPEKPADYHAYGRGNTSRNRHNGYAKDMPSSISGHGWEEHSTVDPSRGIVLTDAQQDQPVSRNTSHSVHVAAADEMLNWLDYEIQHSRTGELPVQHAKQLHDEDNWKSQQNAMAIPKLEELTRCSSVHNLKSNDAPPEVDNLHSKQKAGGNGTTKHDTSTADISAASRNASLPENAVKNVTVSIGSTPSSNTVGVSKGPSISNVMSSAKNREINMMDHSARKITSQSHNSSAPKHWRRQVDSQERIIREKSNVAESTEYVKSIDETPADTQIAEAKPHEDLSTKRRNSKRESATVRPASPPVLGSEKNTGGVTCIDINNSSIPVQVTSFTGVVVGNIVLDISLASVNQEWAAAAQEAHDTTNSLSRPQQTKKSEKNQYGVLLVENPLWNDNVICTPIKQSSKEEQHEEGGPESMAVAVPTKPFGNHSIVWENVAVTKRTEMERYAHKQYKELHQENLGQILPAENHTASYDHSAKSNLEINCFDKKVLDNLAAAKAEVATEPEKWLDSETSWGQRSCASWKQENTDGSASAVQNLTEQAGYSNVANDVQEPSDQWWQLQEQFESKIYNATEYHSEPTQTVPLPSNPWEPLPASTWGSHRASGSQRCYHVEGQRNVRSNYGYKEMVGRGHGFRGTPALSRARWVPKHISLPESNAQDNCASEWTWDSHEGLSDMDNNQGFRETSAPRRARWMPKHISLFESDAHDNGASEWTWDSHKGLSDMDNSQGFDGTILDSRGSKLTQKLHRDGDMDPQGGQVNLDMRFEDENLVVWSDRDWEYEQLNPTPHCNGHRARGTGVYWGRGRDSVEPPNPTPHRNGHHRGRDSAEPTYHGVNEAWRKGGRHFEHQPEPVGSSDAAPDIQWNRSTDDDDRRSNGCRASSGAGASRERRHFI